MMWSERHGHELYIYWMGHLVMKRWYTPYGTTSLLFNPGWPTIWLREPDLSQQLVTLYKNCYQKALPSEPLGDS